MKLIEILDGAGIDSFNLQNWQDECFKFRQWYSKLGTQEIDEVEMTKAYLKIEHKTKLNINIKNQEL